MKKKKDEITIRSSVAEYLTYAEVKRSLGCYRMEESLIIAIINTELFVGL